MDIQELFPEELDSLLVQKKDTDFLLVDVRQPKEYEAGHIPGAKLLPLPELEASLDELDEERDIVFYCRSGRRSATGAVFARDSGLVKGSIYNLIGGISAWNGKILEEFPKFELLQEVEDPDQALKQAINMEKGTHLLYNAMAEQTAGQPIQRTLKKLSKMETAHAKTIFKQLSPKGQKRPFEEMYQEMDGKIVEGGWELSQALEKTKEEENRSCLFFSELALDLEYRAYDLYRNLAEGPSEPDKQKTFLFLSEQEKAHIRLLIKGLPDCVQSEKI